MTLESVAVAFLRASVAWSKAKRATYKLPCAHVEHTSWGPLTCSMLPAWRDDHCPNCQKREPLMVERRAALKTYSQARRRALRALKQETP